MAENLSTEAKVVSGTFWGVIPVTELTFQRPHIIHPSARKGLNDLTAAGLLVFEDRHGIAIWRPTERMKASPPKVSQEFIKRNSFPITTE